MGYDAFCLIADWPLAVEAYGVARGMGFYWSAPEPDDLTEPTLPFAVERDFAGGWAFQEARWFYESLRPHLSEPQRERSDALLGMLYPRSDFDWINDLAIDADVEPPAGDYVFYAMRPATVRHAITMADGVPWVELEGVANSVLDQLATDDRWLPDVESFLQVVRWHLDSLREAAESDRGAIVLVSF